MTPADIVGLHTSTPEAGPSSSTSLHQTIDRLSIVRRAERVIISPSGKSQSWLIDLRTAFLDPDALGQICSALLAKIAPDATVQLAGMETAAIPLLTGLLMHGHADKRALSGLIIRKERKPTGLGKAVEGAITGAPVVLIDDVFNSGESAEKARVSLEAVGLKPERMLVVIDYGSTEGKRWQEATGIKVESLFALADFDLLLGEQKIPDRKHRYKTKLWQFKPSDPYPYYVVPKSAPLLLGNRLVYGSDTGNMHCLDATTGKAKWRFKAPGTHAKGIWSSAQHHDGRIYFGAYNGNVYCLDIATGKQVWAQPYCEWVGSTPCVVPDNGHLYIGLEYERPREQGSIVALDLVTGEKVWEHFLKVFQHGSGVHWKEGNLVIFGTNDHDVRALDAATGKLVWKFETRRSVKYMPRIDDARGLLTFASFDGSIYVLDVRDGRKIAEFPTDDICYTQPLITHGRIFCGSGDRHLYVIDLDTMKLVRRIDCGARVYSSPRVIGGNSVIFGTNGGIVREIDPLTLQVTGKLTVPDAVTNAVAFTEDGTRVFVPTYMNEIYCYERTITA